MSTTGKAESYVELRGELSLPNAITGKSAYEIAVMNGFDGTEEEWLVSLKGEKGKDGENGKDGKDGRDGKDGENGDTPVRGVDYWTDEDKNELIPVIDFFKETTTDGESGISPDQINDDEIVAMCLGSAEYHFNAEDLGFESMRAAQLLIRTTTEGVYKLLNAEAWVEYLSDTARDYHIRADLSEKNYLMITQPCADYGTGKYECRDPKMVYLVPKATAEDIRNAETKANNTFSNALKGSAIGEAVVITDISPVEHDIKVNVKSKNIIPFPFVGGWLNTSGGVAFTCNDDNTIGVKGTTKSYSYTHLIGNDVDKDSVSPYLEDGKTYTLSLKAMNGETTLPTLIITYTEKATGKLNYVNRTNPTFTVDKSKYTYDYMRLFISTVGVELDCVVGVQLEKDTTTTPWTPYVANTEAVKVLVSDGIAEPIEYSHGEAIKSIHPTTTITTDTVGALVEVEYNKNAEDVVTALEERIATLETMIILQ